MRVFSLFLFCLALSAGTGVGCSKKADGPVGGKQGHKQPLAAEDKKGEDKKAPEQKDQLPRKIIYTAMVNMLVEDFAKAQKDLLELVKAYKGYVINSEVSGTPGSPRTGQWKIRVPLDEFNPFRDALAKLGEPERSSTDSQDVTDEYYDVEARINTKKAEEASLLKLLEKTTGKIEDILAVRAELGRVREEIERHQGRLQVLAKLSAMSTLTVNLHERGSYVPPESATFGSTIGRTISDSWGALLGLARGIILLVVALIPWLPLLVLVGVSLFLVRQKLRNQVTVPVAIAEKPAGITEGQEKSPG
jgi:uncharacterized protein DUF4349